MFIVERDFTRDLKSGKKTYTYYSIEKRYQDEKSKKIKTERISALGSEPSPEDLLEVIEEKSLEENKQDLLYSFYENVRDYNSKYETFQSFVDNINESEAKYSFYAEKHLKKFLIQNFEEVFEDLELYYNSEESEEFDLGELGRLDILAKHKESGRPVIIELKVENVTEDVVGQILKYISATESKLDANNVDAIIVGKSFSKSFQTAFERIEENIECKEYSLEYQMS